MRIPFTITTNETTIVVSPWIRSAVIAAFKPPCCKIKKEMQTRQFEFNGEALGMYVQKA